MATWPGTLPAFNEMLQSDYQAGMADNVIMTQMDVGPPKIRKRATAAVEPFRGTMRLTSTQLAAFKTFYNTTINYGADEFDATHPETGAACSLIFTSQPQRTQVGAGDYLITFEIGILP